MHHYTVRVSLNLGSVFKPVGEVCEAVNASMKSFGFDEKLVLRGEPVVLTIKSDRELTPEELANIKPRIAAAFQSSFPGSDPEVKSITLQSHDIQPTT